MAEKALVKFEFAAIKETALLLLLVHSLGRSHFRIEKRVTG
jgi:hypothetical protein